MYKQKLIPRFHQDNKVKILLVLNVYGVTPPPPPPQVFILSPSEHILILSLYYKAFVANVRLRSLLHVVLIPYYETFLANIRLQFLHHMQILAICCKTKIEDG